MQINIQSMDDAKDNCAYRSTLIEVSDFTSSRDLSLASSASMVYFGASKASKDTKNSPQTSTSLIKRIQDMNVMEI